jgi:hypothetical protein
MPGWCWLPAAGGQAAPLLGADRAPTMAPGKRDGGPNVVIRGGETIMPVLLIPRVRVKSDPSEHDEYIAKLSICLRSLQWAPQTDAGYERRSESRG